MTKLYERVFPRWAPEHRFRPVRSSASLDAAPALSLRWLGPASSSD